MHSFVYFCGFVLTTLQAVDIPHFVMYCFFRGASVVITALYGESPGSSKLPLQRETRKQVYSLAMKHSR